MYALNLLMMGEYEPFIESDIYQKLYSKEAENEVPVYNRKIDFNHQNYQTIVSLAKEYYQWKLKQPTEFIQIEQGEY